VFEKKAHDTRVVGLLAIYHGTLSASLVFRSHVTPNACSAALNALGLKGRVGEKASFLAEAPIDDFYFLAR